MFSKDMLAYIDRVLLLGTKNKSGFMKAEIKKNMYAIKIPNRMLRCSR